MRQTQKNVNFVTMQAYSPYYSYEKNYYYVYYVDKIIYNKLTTLPLCDVYPMLWMFSDIDGYNWIFCIILVIFSDILMCIYPYCMKFMYHDVKP